MLCLLNRAKHHAIHWPDVKTKSPAVAKESRPYFLGTKACKCERSFLLAYQHNSKR